MPKTNKHIKIRKNRSNLAVDAKIGFFSYQQMPVSEGFINKLAEELVQWALEDDDALKLTSFFLSRRIGSRTFYRWAEKFPILDEAREVALEAIGNRRELAALKNKLNSTMVISQQAKYDKSWWALEQKRAELKASTQQKGDTDIRYTIVVDGYEKEEEKKTDNLPEE